MPNRIIREGLLSSEAVIGCTVEARWLFVSMILCADDLGIVEASEFYLARAADVKREHVASLLQQLADRDLVRLYHGQGTRRFAFIPRFGQRFRLRRIKHPLPPDALLDDDARSMLAELSASKNNNLAEKMTDIRGQMSANGCHPRTDSDSDSDSDAKKVSKKEKEREDTRARKGSRLPSDWVLPDEWRDWARQERPELDPQTTADKFRDYWCSKAGREAVKLDWQATWRNWVRSEKHGGVSQTGETAYQRRMRERVNEMSPRIAARAPGSDPWEQKEVVNVDAKRVG